MLKRLKPLIDESQILSLFDTLMRHLNYVGGILVNMCSRKRELYVHKMIHIAFLSYQFGLDYHPLFEYAVVYLHALSTPISSNSTNLKFGMFIEPTSIPQMDQQILWQEYFHH